MKSTGKFDILVRVDEGDVKYDIIRKEPIIIMTTGAFAA
jgi:hypothetical protein